MKKDSRPYCSIIVLNYLGEKFIHKTIESLLRLDYPKTKFEIIIVDNNSLDKSREIIAALAKKHKSVRKNFLNKNYGFSRGNNAGIKKTKGKYIALLNNDCTVDKAWLTELVNTAEKNPEVFAVNSKIFLGSSRRIQNAGICVFQDGYGRDIGAVVREHQQSYEMDDGQFNKVQEVYAACAAASLYRRDHLKRIGLFDESFFMYYEDVEISERARLHGLKVFYSPTACAHHQHAASSREWSPFFIYHTEKGRLLHVFYHFPYRVFICEFYLFFQKSIGRYLDVLYFNKKRQAPLEYFKIVGYFMLYWPYLLLRRFHMHKNIQTRLIRENYRTILAGQWYFKKV